MYNTLNFFSLGNISHYKHTRTHTLSLSLSLTHTHTHNTYSHTHAYAQRIHTSHTHAHIQTLTTQHSFNINVMKSCVPYVTHVCDKGTCTVEWDWGGLSYNHCVFVRMCICVFVCVFVRVYSCTCADG